MSLINEALKRATQAQKAKPITSTNSPAMKPVESSHRSWPDWIVPTALVVLCVIGGILIWQGWAGRKTPALSSATTSSPGTVQTQSPTSPSQIPIPGAAPKVAAGAPSKNAATTVTHSAIPVSQPPNTPVAAATPTAKPAAAEAPTSAPKVSSPAPVASSGPATTAPAPVTETAITAVKSDPQAEANRAKSPAVAAQEPAPASTVNKELPDLKLQGIFYRMGNPSVLINGRTLGIGDSIEGVRIFKIERQSIIVEYAGQRRVIVLR
jgi:hypothetical protein